ncbi:MAG TPA: serine hydrolase domain-containing protein [Candidatus Aquilonibacter sp.]
MAFLTGAAVVCAPVFVAPASAAEPVPTAQIDADMHAAIARHQAHGLTIAILRDGSMVYEHAYGLRDVAGKLPATVATQYEIGSITKQFTAAAIMQLVDAGKIALDAPLATHMPNAPHANEVTIRQLLSHTSGMPEYLYGRTLVSEMANPTTPEAMIARIKGKPLDFPPGTKWEYSNTNYILLGRVIEIASGESYDTYLFDHVIAKAPGADFTTMRDEAKLPQMSRGYADGEFAPPLDDSWAWSAGSLVGTVADLAAWDAALRGGEVVAPSAYAQMTTVQSPPGAETAYGFGLMLDGYDGQPRIWHDGGTLGFSAADQLYPAQHTCIIVLSNDSSAASYTLANRIFEDLYPAIAAEAAKPAPGEEPAFTARVKAVYASVLAGKLDREKFDAPANAALTDAVVAGTSERFKLLGPPLWYSFRGCAMQGTTHVCRYLVAFSHIHEILTVGTDPQGKFDLILLEREPE